MKKSRKRDIGFDLDYLYIMKYGQSLCGTPWVITVVIVAVVVEIVAEVVVIVAVVVVMVVVQGDPTRLSTIICL